MSLNEEDAIEKLLDDAQQLHARIQSIMNDFDLDQRRRFLAENPQNDPELVSTSADEENVGVVDEKNVDVLSLPSM